MQLEILVDGKVLNKYNHKNQIYAEAPNPNPKNKAKNSYTIKLQNNYPARRLVVVSVDGLNVMDGKEASHTGPGYVIEAYQSIEIPGWRRSDTNVAAFEFSEKSKSYSAKVGKGTKNVGVIGVAVFDEKVKPYTVTSSWILTTTPWVQPMQPFHVEPYWFGYNGAATYTSCNNVMRGSASLDCNSLNAERSAPATKSVDVGTGYGQSTAFYTHTVEFERASTKPAEVLSLHYATRERLKKMGVKLEHECEESPNPFPQSQVSVPAPPGWNG